MRRGRRFHRCRRRRPRRRRTPGRRRSGFVSAWRSSGRWGRTAAQTVVAGQGSLPPTTGRYGLLGGQLTTALCQLFELLGQLIGRNEAADMVAVRREDRRRAVDAHALANLG